MHYKGYEKDRNTVKRRYPAAAHGFSCKGQEERYRPGEVRPDAKNRIVLMEV